MEWGQRIRTNQSTRTPLVALATIVALLLGLTSFSLWRATAEANAVDIDRTTRAVNNAIKAQLQQIIAVATDNGEWDDAAVALYAAKPDFEFATRSWRDATSQSGVYDTAFAFQTGQAQLFGFERGAESKKDFLADYGRGLSALVAQADLGVGRSGGIIRVQDGLRLVGLTRVRPTDAQLEKSLVGKAPVYIVFSRKLDGDTLGRMGRDLVVGALRILPASQTGPLPLRDPLEQQIATLSWEANRPGNEALWRSLPWMLGGLLICFVAIFILARFGQRSVQELNRAALIDPLSQLPNRRALREAVIDALRKKSQVTLAFLDLDGFKGVNDNYGHAVGDQLIQQCAFFGTEIAKMHGCELVARLGGDEFAIMAKGPDADAQLDAAVKSTLARFSEPFRLGDRAIQIGVSIGLATTLGGATTTSELMRQADIAMYASKRFGKMRKTWFSAELDQMQAEAHDIETGIREALDNEDFAVHYQPLIDARTGAVSSVEALLRWEDPTKGNLSPAVFIPVAEETGLINRLGIYVLRKACMDAIAWPDIQLSVNVSAAQLRNPDFPKLLEDVLNETGFPAKRLEIEITETYIVLDPETAQIVLTQIQALGVSVALDDFGTGFASIGFLRQFNFDKLKIDRSLVTDSVRNEGSRAMLHASISVARAMGMAVVAEGIENEGQAVFMRSAGCDQLQGWHFSRAIAASEIDDVIHAHEEFAGTKDGLAAKILPLVRKG